MSYSEKLRDPRWLAVRKRVLARDGRRCVNNPSHKMPLEVHHLRYDQGHEPWDYSLEVFQTLCHECHLAEHRLHFTESRPRRRRGRFYGWHQIQHIIGHEPQGYLTQVAQNIVCGCFKLDLNPDAPDIVLPGKRGDWIQKATLFSRQDSPVPIFIKGEGLP